MNLESFLLRKGGRDHGHQVARSLQGKAKSVRIVELPEVNGKAVKDAADFFAAGGTADQVRDLIATAPEFVSAPEPPPADQPDSGRFGRAFPTPLEFFQNRFPRLGDKYGSPVSEQADAKGVVSVRDISEDFMAATLGFDGCAESPTVFVPAEQGFFRFSPADGIYILQREPVLVARLSELFLECARACREGCDTRSLEFRFRDSASLAGTLRKAKGLLEVGPAFFSANLTEFIPCANGMLHLSDGVLRPFDPSYRRRNKLAVPFVPGATCPLFIETLMRPALEADDLNLLQRWCGLALIGENLAQRIILLSGTPGGGKGTFIRVLAGIIGANNIASLRPNLLGERFELGRFLGRTLLYGADVPENFLNCRGASVLKMLTGGDPATLELKGSNERPEVTCRFNVIATSNSRLTVNLEGDADAWRRRLAIVRYDRTKSQRVIADLSERIIASEASGVLNWMLEGLAQIRADGWQLELNHRQQEVVDGLLMESGGHTLFVRDQLERVDGQQGITIADTFAAYVSYCNERSWTTLPRNKFAQEAADSIARRYGLVVRHDIMDQTGKPQRGWKGLALVSDFPGPSGKKASETSESRSEPPSPDTSDGCLPVGPVVLEEETIT